jgi:hypothetical protein
MREFFRGWRRKVGCVTLMVACILLCGWVRSRTKTDELRIYFSGMHPMVIHSTVESVAVTFPTERHLGNKPFGLWWSTTEPWPISQRERPPITWQESWEWRWLGITQIDKPYHKALAVSYWSLVIPLTLLSAYLILWKPRKRSPQLAVDTTRPE